MNIAGRDVCYMCGESLDDPPSAMRSDVSRDDSEPTKLYVPSGWRISPLPGGKMRIERVGLNRFNAFGGGIGVFAVSGIIVCLVNIVRVSYGSQSLAELGLPIGIGLGICAAIIVAGILWCVLGRDELIVAPGYLALVQELGPYRRLEEIQANDAVLSVDMRTYYTRTGKNYRAKLYAVFENRRIFLTQETASQGTSILQIAPCLSIATGWPVLNG